MSELRAKVRKQMEFYFSEGNLPKDKFLQEQLARHADGFVPLEVFLCFNKIRPCVQSVPELARCLKKSTMLHLNADKTGVRRRFELKALEPVDERTVYLEGLPANAEADALASWFSKAVGKVLFVSLPRFRSSGDGKRFGFVEFERSADAHSAVVLLSNNGKPAGIFPIANKQLWRLRQHAQHLGIDVAGLEAAVGAARTVLPPPPPPNEAADPMESLRAASKKAWLRLKRSHFRATRRFQRELEQKIAAAQKGMEEEAEKEEEEKMGNGKEEEAKPFDLPPGSVFALCPANDALLSKADVRKALSDVAAHLSYIDVTAPGAILVRCCSETAAQQVTAFIADHRPDLGTTRRLSAEEERLYSQRIVEDRRKKQKKRLTKRRKRQEEEEEEEAPVEAERQPAPPAVRTPRFEEKDEEGEKEEELVEALLGTVVVLRDAPAPLTKASLRTALTPVTESVAYLDVIAGDTTAFVRCRDRSAAAAVAEQLDASGLGAASRLQGAEEQQYLRRVLRSQCLKKARNARRKLKEAGEGPAAKRAKTGLVAR